MTARARGRPRLGASAANRDRILDAARELFAESGFERTTMRAIAGRVGVDTALIHHYFGTKDALVVEALRPDIDPATIFAGLADHGPHPGTEFARRALHVWEDDGPRRDRAVALLRIAMTHNEIAERMRAFYLGLAQTALGDLVGGDDRDLRLALVAGQMLGLAMMRHVLVQPDMAAADLDDLARRVGPVIDHYLSGSIDPGELGEPQRR
ncbi:TetR family transcriptional regulator [Gordonia sp. CPCC 206044]|uniref:TetR/AcrR family transcriptional regulator n=1 Tax=Gordonia sp. CPCC 206044 TaxID=3140793 RepID=UPI003AF35400